VAAAEKFDGFISTDKKLEFEQNLKTLPLAIIILDVLSNSFEGMQNFGPFVQQLLGTPLKKVLYIIESAGNVLELIEPRKKP
jgi:hypothetical protein